MVAGYTYGHSLDAVGRELGLRLWRRSPAEFLQCLAAEYGNSDFDIRHRLDSLAHLCGPWTQELRRRCSRAGRLNSIVTLQSAQPWGPIDMQTDAAGTGPLPVSPPANAPIRWSFYGKPSDFKSTPTGIPYFSGASRTQPARPQALAVDGGTAGAATAALNLFGCYAQGASVMIPPPLGQFGNMGRNIFRDTGFRNFDFSVAKNWHLGEKLRAAVPRRILQYSEPSELRESVRRTEWIRVE